MNKNKILEDENPALMVALNMQIYRQNTQQLWEGQELLLDDIENETQRGDKI